MNQHTLAGAQLRAVNECLPRGKGDDRNGRCIDIRNRFRLRRRFIFVGDRILGVTAIIFQAQVGVNRIAGLELRDLAAGFFDDSGKLAPLIADDSA